MKHANDSSWVPASARDVQEETAQATLRKIQRCQVHVPLLQRSLQTAYLHTAAADAGRGILECGMAAYIVNVRIFDLTWFRSVQLQRQHIGRLAIHVCCI